MLAAILTLLIFLLCVLVFVCQRLASIEAAVKLQDLNQQSIAELLLSKIEKPINAEFTLRGEDLVAVSRLQEYRAL